MELEETKKVLLIIQDKIEYELQFIYEKNKRTELNEYVQAIDTVIHELVALQNLLDEKNEEIEHLQKENEELKDIDLATVHIKGVCDEKDRWRNKIREKIEKLEYKIRKYSEINAEYYENIADAYAIYILQDLLKEE